MERLSSFMTYRSSTILLALNITMFPNITVLKKGHAGKHFIVVKMITKKTKRN